jgi:hypothetical protein
MAVDHVKSTPLTNLDATPRVPNTAGEGGTGELKFIDGYATAVAASSVGATYQLVRVPSSCKIKYIAFESEAQTAGKFDLGVFYATDGSKADAATSLLVSAAVDADLFASAIDCAALVVATDVTNESTTYSLDKRTLPLWQAAGLSSDPKCNFDIVASVITTAVTTGTGKFGIKVLYTN